MATVTEGTPRTSKEWLEANCPGRLRPDVWARCKARMEAPLPPLPSALPSERENNAGVAS